MKRSQSNTVQTSLKNHKLAHHCMKLEIIHTKNVEYTRADEKQIVICGMHDDIESTIRPSLEYETDTDGYTLCTWHIPIFAHICTSLYIQ